MILKEIQWEVTNKCNLQCKHCLTLSGKPRPNELTTKEEMMALLEFHSIGATNIYFTGGEPFSRSDFLALLQKTASLGLHIDVITNATMLDRKILKVIKDLDVKLGISLDGPDALTNDAIRGQGTFEKIIKTLQWCQNIGVPVQLYVVVVSSNIDQLEVLGGLAKKYGCTGIHFNEVTLAGRALKFIHDLGLSNKERGRLPNIIASVATKMFDEKLSQTDNKCWVDGSTLYMAADGNLYLCSEISQRRPDFMIGNIRSFSFQRSLMDSVQSSTDQKCCYGVRASEHVTFIANALPVCIFASDGSVRIETLEQLYQGLDKLYSDIGRYCNKCQDSDCVGYVWLLPQEAKDLYEQGIEILEVNKNVNFLHSLVGKNGEVDIEQFKPPCLWHKKKKCAIYNKRPLMCRMYPLAFATEGSTNYLVLHLDCPYSRQKINDTFFQGRAINLFKRLSAKLFSEIVGTINLLIRSLNSQKVKTIIYGLLP